MTLTAMLMAGGESHRMGKDKATIFFGGEMLWQRQLSLLKSMEPQKLCVSARTRLAWCPSDVETILDLVPHSGPLSGIAAALSSLQTSHLLALAVDMPRMSPEHLKKLVHLAERGCGVVPLNNHSFEPLCAIYPGEAASTAVGGLFCGRLSLQDFVQDLHAANRIRTYTLSKAELGLYQNVNTPNDLTTLR